MIDLVTKGLSGGIQAVEQLNKQYQFLTPSVEAVAYEKASRGRQSVRRLKGHSRRAGAIGFLLAAANQSGTFGN